LNLEVEIFKRSELPGKYIAKILFKWNDRKFKYKYLKKLERSWVRWKDKRRQNLERGYYHDMFGP